MPCLRNKTKRHTASKLNCFQCPNFSFCDFFCEMLAKPCIGKFLSFIFRKMHMGKQNFAPTHFPFTGMPCVKVPCPLPSNMNLIPGKILRKNSSIIRERQTCSVYYCCCIYMRNVKNIYYFFYQKANSQNGLCFKFSISSSWVLGIQGHGKLSFSLRSKFLFAVWFLSTSILRGSLCLFPWSIISSSTTLSILSGLSSSGECPGPSMLIR